MDILRQYEKDGMQITEYTIDGKTASNVVKTALSEEPDLPEANTNELTDREVADATYMEVQYQTVMLEMQSGF